MVPAKEWFSRHGLAFREEQVQQAVWGLPLDDEAEDFRALLFLWNTVWSGPQSSRPVALSSDPYHGTAHQESVKT